MNSRILLLQEKMRQNEVAHILVWEASSIRYLVGQQIAPSLWPSGLLVPAQGKPKWFKFTIYRTIPSDDFDAIDYHQNANPFEWIAKSLSPGALFVDKRWSYGWIESLRSILPPGVTLGIDSFVDDLRSQKDEEEQRRLREASRIADVAMLAIRPFLKIGISEREIAQKIEAFLLAEGADKVSFSPIVSFGKNTSYNRMTGSKLLEDGDNVILDFGAKYQGYCSDITRFFCFRSHKKAQELYNVVLQAHGAALAIIRPGVRFSQVHAAARQVIEQAGYGEHSFYPTGHGVGIGIHELFYVASTNDAPLLPGMCFSIEPGIYLRECCGARVEDLVLVTENGYELLNRIPRDDIYLD